MKYYSTLSPNKFYSMRQAALVGLAPDGGLFMPEVIPTIDLQIVEREAEKSFAHLAYYLADKFFGEDIEPDVLRAIVFDAFDFPITMAPSGALELFNGPTLAFKDFGARFMGRMVAKLKERDMVILTATSGDTGSAVAGGFLGMDGIRVVILYPEGRVSDFQERQMTTLGSNITALSVRGSFDDCQAMVKAVFADHAFCSANGVTSANSISILRWIPQSFYYFYGYYLWKKAGGNGAPVIVVPSGNFGNITAGILAHKMGLPVAHFVAATNANDTVVRFMATQQYDPQPSVVTLSSAMDVGDPSNFARLKDLYHNDISAIKRDITAFSFSDIQTQEAIRELYATHHYVSDPHSAVGYLGLKNFVPGNPLAGFYIATAHASKFGDTIHQTLGFEPPMPSKMNKYYGVDKHFTTIDPDESLLRPIICGDLDHLDPRATQQR
ncbi:MAG: threonine synthase [Mucinivorans sp.]